MIKKDLYVFTLQSIKARLEKDYGYKVAFISLYGSQNYNLEVHEGEFKSDIDMKAVIIPSLDDVVSGRKPVSKTIKICEWYPLFKVEHVDVKDIREYYKNLKKGNPSYLETLFTPYKVIDEEYKEEFINIYSNIRDFVKVNRADMLKAAYGMAKQKEHALSKVYPSTKEVIEKYGYDPKQIHHIFRLYLLVLRYFFSHDKYDFKKAIWHDKTNSVREDEFNTLLYIKKGNLSLEKAEKFCKHKVNELQKMREELLDDEAIYDNDYNVNHIIGEIIKDIVVKSITKEILEKEG